jgi:transcriptional regulator GlxA family with amidase domain
VKHLEIDDGYESFARLLAVIADAHGGVTVDELAQREDVSVRQVERLFARHLGIAPKTIATVLRFQRALKALMRDPGCPLAEVAASAGYFDQAHFIKDFKRMSGGVPRGYRGYYPPEGPEDFAPNVVVFLQDDEETDEPPSSAKS